ncbi:guanine nucleotide exchange factor for Rab-3A-like [Coccinella septempunctata]|uniref:guanine nucleotide exchange factor for Rab-3A-like n=1 Tax=Coccinella septempunctata TaxID=41139 RepID=UPI001D0811D5|nr:guanine nucleotide exchange factor for Rab-3A-like [Coccinella septempunctata]XP_044749201.1 guanine nucleotide exchange factor for Rab-3A-like [Coccinella septempunctata]
MSENKIKRDENLRQKDSLSRGLLMVPTNVKGLGSFPLNHKRTGSTGTTGDESYTTDEDEGDIDETDFDLCNLKQPNFFSNDFGSLSGISTITDGINHTTLMQRNSSDLSVYSGVEKCGEESVNSNGSVLLGEIEGDCECESVDWAKTSSVMNMDNFTFTELKVVLKQAHRQLKARKEEIHKLNRIKQDVEDELEDLTANLFQEAHNMVREANEKQAAAERALRENEMKVEVLMAEVAALKTLVITSTPSRPNPHLHPQIDKNKDEANFNRKHNRSPSHSYISYGRAEIPSSPTRTTGSPGIENYSHHELEIDPTFYDEFLSWKEMPVLDKTTAFISRIYEEDIKLCLTFTNSDLSAKIMDAVERGTLFIEALGEKSKNFQRDCALMNVPKICSYRMNLGDENDDWYHISQICRNRITAVCDFLNYLKYIERGLVKSSAQDMFHEVMRLRRNMVLGRMGFPTNS